MRADGAARGFALGRVVLDRRRHGEVGEVLVELARGAGVALGDGPPFDLAGLDQIGAAPAVDRRGELPGEVRGVVHAGVHAEAAGRREQVRGIACQDDASGDETLGHQRDAGGPQPMVQHLMRKLGADALWMSCDMAASLGCASSPAALEKIRNSSSPDNVMMVARTSGLTTQYCQP